MAASGNVRLVAPSCRLRGHAGGRNRHASDCARLAALRCLYRRAVDDGLISEAGNLARKVTEPRRLPATRRALPDARLAEINQVAATTGDDPEVDTLILRLHAETACRRGGARGGDVDDAVLRPLAAGSEIADLTWDALHELAAEHSQVFQDAMRAHLAGESERAGRLRENLQAIWSQALPANYAVLEFMQGTGLTRFAPVKPQHWVAALLRAPHQPHGLPWPRIHNIAVARLTTAALTHTPTEGTG